MGSLIRDFWNLTQPCRKAFVLAAVALVAATAFQLVLPWVLRMAIDSLTARTNDYRLIIMLASGLVGAAAGEAIFTFLKGKWAAEASEGTVTHLRNRMFEQMVRMPFSAHGTVAAGDFIQRATSDIQTLGRFLSVQVTEVARTVCLLAGVSTLMFMMQPTLALAALALLPPIFLFSMVIFRKIQKRFETLDETEAALSSNVQEYLTGVRVVRAFAREPYESGRFRELNARLVREDIALSTLHAVFWPTSDVMCMLQAVIVLYLGGMKAVDGDISLGTFVAFNSYVMYLIWPVRQIGRLLGEMGRASVSMRRIREILDLPREADAEGAPEVESKRLKGGVYFKHVSFGFDGQKVLHDIHFRVRPGKTVAILGATGSGKTTLMQLLLRFHDDYSGAIYIDDRDIRQIPKDELRSQIGIVLQEAFLFSKSIYDNISFGVDQPERRLIRNAAAAAAVDRFVSEFPERYRTVVGERGVTLSGGQKQRIALARVLVKRPSILILDDTTSALDTETEAAIWSSLRKWLSDCTAFIITHRLSTAAAANKIIVLDKGRIVQQGNHEELIRQPGHYRKLHEQQWAKMAVLDREASRGHARRRVQ